MGASGIIESGRQGVEGRVWRGASTAGRSTPRLSHPRRVSMARVVGMLVVLDLSTALAAAAISVALRFGDDPGTLGGVSYALLVAVLPPIWLALMALCGAYQRRHLVTGAEEYRRVFNGGAALLAAIAIVSFVLHADLSRQVSGAAVALVTLLTLLTRFASRKALHRAVSSGRTIHRVLAVGSEHEVVGLARHLSRAPLVGLSVIGACIPGERSTIRAGGGDLPVSADVDDVAAAARALDADTVALAGSDVLRTRDLRRVSWQLEGTGIDLVVAPAMTDVAGPRIQVWPVHGLPLLHVDEPRFTGATRVMKEAFDLVAAAVALVVLSPLMLAIAVLVRLSSPGPVIFRQERIGVHGERFTIWKFRTMRVQAEEERRELLHLNDIDGAMFKLRRDPRMTRAGRWLRRYSLDELPQLWNVLFGPMSLVGPRPPLPDEVAAYGDDARRRLLVKPGMTGLWQVSGRSDMPWEEAVRLDLYYIQHWSVWLDLLVLWKTVGAVLHARGAY